jgi:hypothetical protein
MNVRKKFECVRLEQANRFLAMVDFVMGHEFSLLFS